MKKYGDEMRDCNLGAFASSTAFFLFLSMVPMLMVICMVIPYTPITEENLLTAVSRVIPASFTGFVEGVIADVYEKSAGALSIAIIAMLWSAGKGMLALMRGLNVIYRKKENRNYFVLRTIATIYTMVLLFAMLLSLFIMVFGNKVVRGFLQHVPQLQTLFGYGVYFRFLASWVVLTILFAVLYTYVPKERLKFREQLNGAAFAAVMWNLFSWGFSVYVEHTNSFTIYGSLTMIVITLIWMYCCMYIVLIGAYLNYLLTGNKKKDDYS